MGDLASARRDVRQLARLIRTHGILLAELIAVTLLAHERAALDAAAAQGLPLPAGLDALTLDELDDTRQLIRLQSEFFMPGVAPEVMRRAAECGPALCSSLTAAMFHERAFGALSPEPTGAALDAEIARSGCVPGVIDDARRRAPFPVEEVQAWLERRSPLAERYGE